MATILSAEERAFLKKIEEQKDKHKQAQAKSTRHIKRASEEIYDRIKHKEQRYRIYPFSKLPYYHLSVCMEAWLRGTSFDKILRLTDTDEGEIVRYFRMSVQILREINCAEVCSLLDQLIQTRWSLD